jgi:Xaa-Pro aminopeptidase
VACRVVGEAAQAGGGDPGLGHNSKENGAGQVPYVGDGIGIELDELPVLTGSSLELEPGMVFALEPKFVLPELGAVGIENTWVVTAGGVERLTHAPDVVTVVD